MHQSYKLILKSMVWIEINKPLLIHFEATMQKVGAFEFFLGYIQMNFHIIDMPLKFIFWNTSFQDGLVNQISQKVCKDMKHVMYRVTWTHRLLYEDNRPVWSDHLFTKYATGLMLLWFFFFLQGQGFSSPPREFWRGRGL